MGRNLLIRLYHTLKHLKLKQVYYQLVYRIRKKLNLKIKYIEYKNDFVQLRCINLINNHIKYKKNHTFIFLNISHDFDNKIDWNFDKYGKLWIYNLNYFDFLYQPGFPKEEGLNLILEYIEADHLLVDGKEPYPISLRGINWVKFLSHHLVNNQKINYILYNHYRILFYNLEYHLLGNHLLENGFSLIFGGYYFQEQQFYQKGYRILKEELNEQLLEDGGHFELSPMYHQIILGRLLETIALIQNNNWIDDDLLTFCENKAKKMLSWLCQMTFRNGSIPLFNDSSFGIAPTTWQLENYAKELKINEYDYQPLSESGYRKYESNRYECIVDVGQIGPDYIPGHAHADMLNFELYVDGVPMIVDTGTSTYEKNERRQLERSTSSHNTVTINRANQSDVWGGFRVGQRAKITNIEEEHNYVKATHNGYKDLGLYHTREFDFRKEKILIKDFVSGKNDKEQVASFHFHPSIENVKINDNKLEIINKNVSIFFSKNIYKIKKEIYEYASEFNKKEKAIRIKVFFNKPLETIILFDMSHEIKNL